MNEGDRLAGKRLRSAFDLYAAALDIQRVNLRRRFPRADDAEVESRLRALLLDRPGPPTGGADWVPTHRPRIEE